MVHNSVSLISEGALRHESKASGHTLSWTKAVIQKPAPYWEGTAAYKGEMKEIKLDDYRKYPVQGCDMGIKNKRKII